ncbi:SDR family oxidoreductase [Corynebacterium belfantii]|uniref:SDR family oxidoreductase n=1 Tax=Corynebacterium belfantii TaxID=2014537 RepID=A0ABS0LFN8_9CORY|nr:SDR family oxidoreductase [Corynebacterium belfantii]OLN14945.1 hypothetical protein BUE64_10095 [Corynebacterium diphtheriae subsp. lausannense]MBG9311360.1 SDR family oxidoreductase [Corynebacterium belfantii]MBG9329108.1 SDR family oxidoreductase [Corynebacterium belfantii]MBG9347783.1 SDR family oxidoreductase [Corynebacterium belfantii]MBG9350252.1 SDR family oxidoreductase [Corynebacterium belfantii]
MTATPQRNALVLGASSGIGAATAKHLAAEGFAVAVVARRAAELDSVVQDIRTRGGQAYSATYDLAVDGASTQAVQWAVEQLGQVDVVVYSAGMVRLHAADEWRRDWWERQWRLNTLAAAEAAAASVPAMRRRGSGWFIVIGSAAGLTPVPGTGGYGVSKAAAHHLVQMLSAENRRFGVHAYAICPGWVRTDLAADPGALGVMPEQLLLPEDIAEVITWLVSLPPRVQISPLLEVQTLAPEVDVCAGIQRFLDYSRKDH